MSVFLQERRCYGVKSKEYKTAVMWNVTTFILVHIYLCYGNIYQLHFQMRRATVFGGRVDFVADLLDLSYFIYAFYRNFKLALLSKKI